MYDRLDVDSIEANTPSKVVLYSSTASTNDTAWRFATKQKYNGLAVLAEAQTSGRGRQGNNWIADKYQSILCSILFMDCKAETEIITLAVPIAIAQTLNKNNLSNAKIKWPNDVLVDDKKIAGVLIESRRSNTANNFVIGIGINCHQSPDSFKDKKLTSPATSIDWEIQGICDRNKIAADLINSVTEWVQIASSNTDQILKTWHKLSIQIGQRVKLKYKDQNFAGNCIGVDPIAGLILQLDAGTVRMFDAAHTTIIKQHQY